MTWCDLSKKALVMRVMCWKSTASPSLDGLGYDEHIDDDNDEGDDH